MAVATAQLQPAFLLCHRVSPIARVSCASAASVACSWETSKRARSNRLGFPVWYHREGTTCSQETIWLVYTGDAIRPARTEDFGGMDQRTLKALAYNAV